MPNWKLEGASLVEDVDMAPIEGDAFDPSEHTIDEVKEYVEANPASADDVLTAEQAGKDRVTLVAWLTDRG